MSVWDEQYAGVKDYFWDGNDAWDDDDSVEWDDVWDDVNAIEGNDEEQKPCWGLEDRGN